jgi:hypothetical protein
MPNILVSDNFYQGTSSACIVDLTPPTFAGITFLDVESRGQIRAGWSAATDATAPIRYEIYIKASTSTGLFSTTNIIAVTPNLQYDIFTLPDGSFLVNGTTYYVGVRAIDGVNNRDSNVVSMDVISTGVLTAIDVYQCRATWSTDTFNNFVITMWADKNQSLANSSNSVMGAASFQVYDKSGAAIVGMSGTVPSPTVEGLYAASPVANLTSENHNHFEIEVTITVDGEARSNFIPVGEKPETYTIDGTADVDDGNNLVGSFWITQNEKVVTTGLGLGAWQAFDTSGNLIPGLAETGITPNGDGFFSVTPFPLPPGVDTTHIYIIRITTTVNGEVRSNYVKMYEEPAVYNAKATFSINAANMLQATLWGCKNNLMADTALLGTASYAVYDKNGTAVAGLSETGITPDVNGLFHTTPVAATLLTDLTHYNVVLMVSIAGADRTTVKGFTLLGN